MKEAVFPNRVKELRLVRFRGELSQQELAERAGISAGALSAIEDQRVSPKMATGLAIARALGVSLDDLFLPAISAESAEESSHTSEESDASAGRTAPPVPSVAVEGDQAVGNPDADGERVR